MRPIIFIIFLLFGTLVYSQNIDYQSSIVTFYAGTCGNENGMEEHTWLGYLSDNINFGSETYSGCIQQNTNTNAFIIHNGTWATRNRTNVPVTQMRARIDGWEDDGGSRCTYDAGNFFNNGDDCRRQAFVYQTLNNPNEYANQTATWFVGSTNDYRLRATCSYRYATTTLPAATDYNGTTFSTGGNRPFWGCRGSWAQIGADCAASGTITHNQTSSFSTTVSCKQQVRFRWRVSSQTFSDYLEVYVNGVRKNRISGNVGWNIQTINLDYGSNTVEWRYVKDGSGSTGLDRGFVDEISFINATSVVPGSISGNQYVVPGGTPSALSSTSPAQGFFSTPYYQWQTSANNITWTNIGGANSISYSPVSNGANLAPRYFRRRVQDGCGNTGYSNTVLVNVMPIVANTTNETSVGYQTAAGWHHFYNSSNEVILSLSGNISGATATPVVTISKNSTYYQDLGTPANCTTGPSPGDAKFEMERSWNVSYSGTLSGTYNVRFYYLQAELDSVVGASYRHQNNNPNCTYGNRFGGSNGFYWFKTTTPTYTAPTYDTTQVLSSLLYSVSTTLKYAQLSGITGFSGGSGGIVLRPITFLPVEFMSFSGSLNESDNVELEWSTASELNNTGFYIQKSVDNEYFEEIGFVEGNGTTQSLATYQFEDETYDGGEVYYRLEQVDYDGSTSYSESILIRNEKPGAVLVGKLIPNPTKGDVSIVIISPQKTIAYIDITDQYGQRIESLEQDLASGQTKVKLDLQPYRSGLYYAIIQVGSESFTKKIVLTR